MAYVAYYRRKADYKLAVRLITRGFACTRDELKREIAIRCGALQTTLSWDWVDSAETGKKLVDVASKIGYKVDS